MAHGDTDDSLAGATLSTPQLIVPLENAEFDAVQFLLSLEHGEYNARHTLFEWTSGDLERLDALLHEQDLGLPTPSRLHQWWSAARPRIPMRHFAALVFARHRFLLASSTRGRLCAPLIE